MRFVNYQQLISILLWALLLSCKTSPSHQLSTLEVSAPDNNGSLPFLSRSNSQVLLSWVEQQDSSNLLFYSTLDQSNWSEPTLITSGKEWFVNWADFPMVFRNQGGEYMAHYLKKSGSDTYAYDVQLMYSKDGTQWSSLGKLHDDTTKSEHGFVSVAVPEDGSFQYQWLDGRETSGSGHHSANSSMTLRTREIQSGRKLASKLIDPRTCDCCQTSSASSAYGQILVYRDRSALEIRDIYFVKKSGNSWTKPQPVHQDQWRIEGCPVNGPQVSVSGKKIAVSWYTATNDQPMVKLAFSSFSDSTFTQPMVLDKNSPLGRVDIDWIDNHRVAVSWISRERDYAVLKLGIVHQLHGVQQIHEISKMDQSRTSGFPQMVTVKNEVLLASTEVFNGKTSIKTHKIAL